MTSMTQEAIRLQQAQERTAHWRRWGPYLSERQWGTVREDYSPSCPAGGGPLTGVPGLSFGGVSGLPFDDGAMGIAAYCSRLRSSLV
jgi:hypothetical protein